ncbi:MAG TPA: hypothetical protein VE781_16895 [Kineosporiaceae bacterium]|nr:hypothetical protein [Kineosporiaceae bacterium]
MSDQWGAPTPPPPPAYEPPAPWGGQPGEPPAPGGGRPAWRRVLRSELTVVASLLASGLLLGGAWALFGPSVADGADPGESRVAVDGLLALLQLGAGLVTAVVLTLLPGREPVARVAAVILASAGAGWLAVLVGAARGLHLQSPGAALLWPLVVAVLTALRLLVGLQLSPNGGRRTGP